MHGGRQQGGRANRQAPNGPSLVRTPCIERAADPMGPLAHGLVHRVAFCQRPNLFDQQCKKKGQKAHARIIAAKQPTQAIRKR